MRDVRILRSFIAPDSLAEIIDDEYLFDSPVACKMFSKLLRTQDNDHYQVKTEGQKYVARIYQPAERLMRHESDYLFELDWLTFLRDRGCPVAYPIRRKDGGYLGKLNAPEGLRYYALFSFARGESPITCVEFARRNIEPSVRPGFAEMEASVKEKQAA